MTPVTASFLDHLRACTPAPAGALFYSGAVVHPIVGRESGAWSLGLAEPPDAYTITPDVLAELQGSTALADGTYTRIDGAVMQLVPNAGTHACEPDVPPPPPPA